MTVTVYDDVFLSNDVIAAGVRGKNMRSNSRVALPGGDLDINVVWSRTLRQYELGFIAMTLAAWQSIETLHEITEGGAFGFLLEDPIDHQVTGGVMTEVSTGIYQLHKRYLHGASSRYKDRTITRPRAAGFVVTNNGTPVVSYTLDVETGRITIPAEPDAEDLAWSGLFYVPVHFMEDTIDWEVIRPGSDSARLVAGPSVVLQEVRE